jgi:hypothetical protein
VNDIARVMGQLTATFEAVSAVIGDNGRPLVETTGVERKQCNAWREQLSQIDEELVVWGRTFQRMYAASIPPDHGHSEDEPEQQPDADLYADAEEWEPEASAANSN